MGDAGDSLRVEQGGDVGRLRLAYQRAPPGAASFSATYVGPAGWGYDETGSEGTARIANHLLTTAAGPYDRVALARHLDRSGATLSRQSSPEAGEVTIWGPSEGWSSLLELLATVVQRPRFDADDLARIRRQMAERQLRERTQPGSRAEWELLHAVYPKGHPYRESGLGDRRSLARIRRDTLLHFHRRHYTARDAALVVTTTASLRAVERAARDAFGSLRDSPVGELDLPAVSRGAPRRVEVNLPGRSQVEVRLGGASIAQSSPEYPGGFLANEALGGRPMLGRLFQRVREANGLAYHASSHLDTMRLGGTWTAGAGTGPDRWKKVVPMLEEEVDRLRHQGVPAPELASVRESAIGEIPLSLESTSDAHALAVDVAYHRLPADFWLTWPTRLRALRPRDVRRGAEAAFAREGSLTVVVGPIGPR